MIGLYLFCVSFLAIALSTLIAGMGRKHSGSARETGISTVEEKPLVEAPQITAGPEKIQPWKDWLQAEMDISSDPNRPWLDWKPNMDDPSDKPWLHWDKRKKAQGRCGGSPDGPGPTTEMMGTYPVVDLTRV